MTAPASPQPGNQDELLAALAEIRDWDSAVAARHGHIGVREYAAQVLAAAASGQTGAGEETDGPTEHDVVGTCDWGGCNGDTVALRLDSRDGRWLSVCTRHRTKASVAVELVMGDVDPADVVLPATPHSRRVLRRAFELVAEHMGIAANDAAASFGEFLAAFAAEDRPGGDDPVDVPARALELRRTRNTGPSRDVVHQRRPRRVI